jgi:hypothetical protein
MQVEASMPLKTVIPIERGAAAPAPVAKTRGSTPRMKAIDVIRIGQITRARAGARANASEPRLRGTPASHFFVSLKCFRSGPG